jgi:hypothetical protein
VKIAAVPEECNTEEQRSVVHFLWAKRLNAKDIHKEILPVYGGKCFHIRPCIALGLIELLDGRHRFKTDGLHGMVDEDINILSFIALYLKAETETLHT